VFFRGFVVLVRRCVVRRLMRRCLISHLLLCGVHLVHIERSASDNHKFNQWFRRQRCRSRSMGILVI